jgi:hypothetical protein
MDSGSPRVWTSANVKFSATRSATCASLADMKGQQKPKKLAKKAPQKSLKEQRAAKAAKKQARS